MSLSAGNPETYQVKISNPKSGLVPVYYFWFEPYFQKKSQHNLSITNDLDVDQLCRSYALNF